MSARAIFIVGQAIGGAYWLVVVGNLFSLVLIKLGCQEILLGLSAAVFPVLGIAVLLLLPILQRGYQRKMLGSAFAMCICAFCILPFFFLAGRVPFAISVLYFFLYLVVFYSFAQVMTVTWFPTVSDLVGRENIGDFFGRLRLLLYALSVVCLAVIARVLGPDPSWMCYFLVFLALALLFAVRPVLFARVAIPPSTDLPQSASYWEHLRTLSHDRGFTELLRYLFCRNFLIAAVAPFYIPFLKTELGLPSSFCVFLGALSLLGYSFSVYSWGKLNDTRGSRFVFTTAIICGVAFFWLLANVQLLPVRFLRPVLMAAFFWIGLVGNAGYEMASTTRRMALAPEGRRFSYLSFINIFGENLPMVCGAPLGGWILEKNKHVIVGSYSGYQLLFLGAGALDLLLLLLVARMQPVKERPLKEIFRDVVSERLLQFRDFLVSPP